MINSRGCFNTANNVWGLLLSSILFISILPVKAAETDLGVIDILSLETAVKLAHANDPWLAGNRHSQDSIDALSIAAGELPDPKVGIGLANIASDTFDFGQEAMTNFNVGVSQVFPRGDTLAIRKRQLELSGSQYPYQRQDRKAKVTVTVSQLWLDVYKAQESIALIDNNRTLFEQLADVVQASYSSGFGRARQQDIVRAQLEMTRLDDRLTTLHQQQDISRQQLYEWLSNYFLAQYSENQRVDDFIQATHLNLPQALVQIKLLKPQLITSMDEPRMQLLFETFAQHPVVKSLEQKIKASTKGIELAKQKYKPEWGINASYGYRADTPMGESRADLVSVGVTFDMPLFTAHRQDKEVQSAVSQTESVKTNKWLLLRKLIASYETARVKLQRLNQRQTLYHEQLLPQTREQAEASLTAYTNDDGDFAEVVRARIAELNAEIDALGIDVERQKAIVQLNYFFMTSADEIIASTPGTGVAHE